MVIYYVVKKKIIQSNRHMLNSCFLVTIHPYDLGLNLSEPQFSRLENGNGNTYLLVYLSSLKTGTMSFPSILGA